MSAWTCKCGTPVPSHEGNVCPACRKAAAVVVAYVTIAAETEMSRCHESAAQYYTVRVQPGRYPVESRLTGKGERYLQVTFLGIVTEAGYGSKRYDSEIGQSGEVSYSPYKYQLHNGQFHGPVEIVNLPALDACPGA